MKGKLERETDTPRVSEGVSLSSYTLVLTIYEQKTKNNGALSRWHLSTRVCEEAMKRSWISFARTPVVVTILCPTGCSSQLSVCPSNRPSVSLSGNHASCLSVCLLLLSVPFHVHVCPFVGGKQTPLTFCHVMEGKGSAWAMHGMWTSCIGCLW